MTCDLKDIFTFILEELVLQEHIFKQLEPAFLCLLPCYSLTCNILCAVLIWNIVTLFFQFYLFTFRCLGLAKMKSYGENLLPRNLVLECCNCSQRYFVYGDAVFSISLIYFCMSIIGKGNGGDGSWLKLGKFDKDICSSSSRLSWSPVHGPAQHY